MESSPRTAPSQVAVGRAAAPARRRSRRGRPAGDEPTLTRAKVLEAAAALLEETGVEQLSMRKIAAELGVEAMSLYNHVANKEAVLDGVADMLLASVELPEPTGDARHDFRALANSFRAAATRRPKAAALVLTRQLRSDTALAGTEAALSALRRSGFEPDDAVHSLRAVMAFLVGTLLREVSAGPTFSGQNFAGVAERRAALADSGFPQVGEAAPHLAVCHHDREFDFGLNLLMSALERHPSVNS